MKFLWIFVFLLLVNKSQASEDNLYDFVWLDPDKEVYVLQNKLFKKENSFYFDLGYIANYTSTFQDTTGFQGKLGYFFHEDWGLELLMNQYSNTDNDDAKNVQIINQQRPFIRRLNSTMALLAIWSPFYGKINTFNKIYYFDWSFGAGLASIAGEDNLETSILSMSDPTTPEKFEKKNFTGAILKTTFKFHIRENIHLGLEYMNTYYKAPSPKSPTTDKLRTNTDLVLSVGFSI